MLVYHYARCAAERAAGLPGIGSTAGLPAEAENSRIYLKENGAHSALMVRKGCREVQA